MFLTSKNDLLYDAKNFNKYRNIFAIILNKRKKYERENIITNMDDDLHGTYIESETTLKLYFMYELISGLKSIYKIIYGHFYSNQNMFIYKNTKNGKNDVIISHETQLCSQKELLHNASNKLIYTNSYESIKKQWLANSLFCISQRVSSTK